MSGHSKWSTIKRKKGAVDANRGNLFSKLSKEIIIAVKQGGENSDSNPRLRTAIAKARSCNMPSQNIQRVIKRAVGDDKDAQVFEMVYEGFGVGGYSLIVKCATDNKNRTNSDIKHLFSKYGASLGKPGSNAPFFSHFIHIEFEVMKDKLEKVLDAIIEHGADDYTYEEGVVHVLVDPKSDSEFLKGVRDIEGIEAKNFEMQCIANEGVELDDELYKKAMNFIQALEEHDDVQGVYTSATPLKAKNDIS